jgi:membrane protein implicated in regulation of membrane protease activity
VRTSSRKFDNTVAKTLTDIPAGEKGRVLYEGGSWAAQCADPTMTIPPDCPVQVIRQQGTTLVVMPTTAQ